MKKYFITIALLFSIESCVQILHADELKYDDLDAMSEIDTNKVKSDVSWEETKKAIPTLLSIIKDNPDDCEIEVLGINPKNISSFVNSFIESHPKSTFAGASLIAVGGVYYINKCALFALVVAAYPLYKSISVLYQEYVESEETEEENS
ncbi:hypothetical protein JKY79_03285 [Candidatus Babeliales bacterium]|nr:hypothetical protein [Candidatus Babeliales bacterium]